MQIDEKAFAVALVEGAKHAWSNRFTEQALRSAITAYLTALASQEGAQAGEEAALEKLGRAIMALPPGMRTADPADGIKKLRAMLAEQEGAQAGEVVAWNCIYPTYGHFTLKKHEAEQAIRDGATVRPLVYADTTPPAPDDAVRVAVEAEREACAQIADRHAFNWRGHKGRFDALRADACEFVAGEIRARKGGAA